MAQARLVKEHTWELGFEEHLETLKVLLMSGLASN